MKAQEVPLPNHQDSAASPAGTGALAGRLWRDYLSRYWGRLLLALMAIAFYAASASAIPIGVEWINAAFSGTLDGNGAQANSGVRFSNAIGGVMVWGPAIILILGATNALSQYVQTKLSASAALRVLRDLQNEMFAAVTASDDAQIRTLGAGQAMTLFTKDTLVMRETLTRFASAVRDALTLAGLCAVMIFYDWVLFLIVIVVYPVLGWPIMRIGKFLRSRSSEAQNQAGGIASLVKETVGGARMVKTYQLETHETARAENAFNERLSLLNSMANLRAMNEPFIFFVGSVALALVVAVVAMRINEGALSGAQFISFIIALLLLSQPARGLSTLNAVMQEGFGALERMLSVIDSAPAIIDREGATPLKVSTGAVAFRNIQFAYSVDAPTLNNLSLDVPAGKVTALVGESGGGKSTLFNLLPRLYDLDKGAIEIDSQSIGGVTLASLRASIALVSQDTALFNDSVAANIALGRPGANRDAIERAAKLAAADEFISHLPAGYETIVGENGELLSGGQRQRIAIARAFLKDAPILLLDEATSALDAQSEAKVQAALARLSKGRTTIIIAHRLATVKGADLIAVIAKGAVIETGTHEALMAKDGVYARFARLQFAESAQ